LSSSDFSFSSKSSVIVKFVIDNIINEEIQSVNQRVEDLDNDDIDEYCKITYKNNTYILDDNKLYKINDDNTKGDLYAKNINGKINKI